MVISIQKSSSSGKPGKNEVIKNHTYLELRLDYPVKEFNDSPLENFDITTFKFKPSLSLHQIIQTIKDAAEDPRIEGIIIHPGIIQAGMAEVEEISNAIKEFRVNGKSIKAYNEFYSQKSYYLASVSEEIILHPAGFMEWKGLASQIMFYKDLLQKLGVRMQIIRHGKFKSAVEPFINNRMSPENRLQIRQLLFDIWGVFLDDISRERKISPAKLNELANKLQAVTPEDWENTGMIDRVEDSNGLMKMLASQNNLPPDAIHTITETNYYYKNKLTGLLKPAIGKEQIAVLVAEGEIVGGEGEKNQIGSDRFIRLIRKLKDDDKVKAVVLRINSPGGSALASELIWKELKNLKEKKPLVVSMGDLAASGGYYIATAADYIFANRTSITGSIGVFGVIPDLSNLMNDKLGIHIDTVKTNLHADMGVFRPLDTVEKNYLQQTVEFTYNTFLKRVAEGRNMTLPQVDSIGQGRVWSGIAAKKIGLVDELGTLKDAIEYTAKLASIEEYKVKFYPKTDNPFVKLLSLNAQDTESRIRNRFLRKIFGTDISAVQNLMKPSGQIQARMPFILKITD
jgi:protease-4